MKSFELTPVNNRKSFYGKCKVEENGNGIYNLISYTTNVARYNANTGVMQVFGQYSNTTCTHIRAFLGNFGFDYDLPISKILDLYPKVEEEQGQEQENSNPFKSIAMVAKMGEIFANTQKEKNDWKARMIKAGISGISIPDDWDTLTEDEKEKRLNKVISVMQEN